MWCSVCALIFHELRNGLTDIQITVELISVMTRTPCIWNYHNNVHRQQLVGDLPSQCYPSGIPLHTPERLLFQTKTLITASPHSQTAVNTSNKYMKPMANTLLPLIQQSNHHHHCYASGYKCTLIFTHTSFHLTL